MPKKKKSSGELGRLLARFGGKSLKPIYIISAALTLIGAGLLIFGIATQPDGIAWIILGGILAVAGPMYLVTNWSGARNTLEVFKGGLRFTAPGETTSLRWDDIEEIQIGKIMNVTYHKLEWNVVIQPRVGDTIELLNDFWASQGGAATLLGLVKGYVSVSLNKTVEDQ